MRNYENPTVPYEQGYNAYIYHCTEKDCPYISGTPDSKEWLSGWKQAKSEHEHRKAINQFLKK